MLHRTYQLRYSINLWIEEIKDPKIRSAKLIEIEWPLVKLIGSILCPFYDATLIVSRIINSSVYLGFRIFDAIFNHLEKTESIFENSNYSFKDTIKSTYQNASKNYQNTIPKLRAKVD